MGDSESRLARQVGFGSPRSLLLRVAVPCVGLAGAVAMVWAGLLGGQAVWPEAAATVVLVVLATLIWEFSPVLGDLGYAFAGVAATVANGVALITGEALPWLLVAFWGGAAVLLAAALDFVAARDSERSAAVSVVAVVALLALSALGLGQYVRATWTQQERAMLRAVTAELMTPGVNPSTDVVPVLGGGWGTHWSAQTGDPAEYLSAMRDKLTGDGWEVAQPAALRLTGRREGYRLTLSEQPATATTAKNPASSVGYTVDCDLEVTADSSNVAPAP
jgi:hypothetical protein